MTDRVKQQKPSRVSFRAVFTVEDAARVEKLEDHLRRDLRAALAERIDA